jgi:hypothetical protein
MITAMPRLPTSFAWRPRWFLGKFLVGSVLRWRLRGILRIAIDDFLELFHCLAQLLVLSDQLSDPGSNAGGNLLPFFWCNRAVGWGRQGLHARYFTPLSQAFSTPLNTYQTREGVRHHDRVFGKHFQYEAWQVQGKEALVESACIILSPHSAPPASPIGIIQD